MPRLLLLSCVLSCAACQTRIPGYPRDWYAGVAFSGVPGVGLSVDGGKVLHHGERQDWAAEAEFIRHFLDDKDLADDGHASHGRMSAVRAGFKHSFKPGYKRRLTLRYGFEWYRATGEPGIVDFPGDYYGAYASIGFETELARHWTMGPEMSFAFLEGEGDIGFEFVPTFFWRVIYDF